MKLSGLQRAPVRVVVRGANQSPEEAEGVDVLRFDQASVAKEIFGPLRRSLLCKIEAQTDLSVIFDTDQSNDNGKAGDETSPFLMLVLAIVCQVKVNKYSESVVQRGEIPKGLHLIIDGKAQIVYEDSVLREVDPSEYCRESQKPKDPIPFKHGPASPDQAIQDKLQNPSSKAASQSPSPKKHHSKPPENASNL